MTKQPISNAARTVYMAAAAVYAGTGVLVTLGGLLMLVTGWPR